MSRITIFDENDEVIGSKERSDVEQSDIYRCTGLWITNSKDEILLQKRSKSKSHSPGKWAPAVAGTVEAEESRRENIIKEAMEELGIIGEKFIKGPKFRISAKYNYFSQIFFATLDWPIEKFKPDFEEMEEIKWIPKKELIKWVNKSPKDFTSGVPMLIEEIYSKG